MKQIVFYRQLCNIRLNVRLIYKISRSKTLFLAVMILSFVTMAPIVDDPELCRPVFRGLKSLFDRVTAEGIKNVEMKYLSMGMTQDFEVAIEEGATLIRVGTAIFKGI